MERLGTYHRTTVVLDNRHAGDRLAVLEAERDALRLEVRRLRDAYANLALLAVVRDMEAAG